MKHEIEAVLKALEAIVTEVDLELWQWQSDIDMLSLAGIEVPLVLYVFDDVMGVGEAHLIHDGGALIMNGEDIHKPSGEEYTKFRASLGSRLAQPAFDEPKDPLPLVMHRDGKKIEIGFAELTILPNGDIVARGEVTKYIPELHEPAPKLSLGYERKLSPESFSIPEFEQEVIGEDGLTPTERWHLRGFQPKDFREWDIDNNTSKHIIEGEIYTHRVDLDNHPFFKNETEENQDGS